MKLPGTIILSRPDALGHAVVTLPMAGWIKSVSPGTRIIVICRNYARAVWKHSAHVDGIVTLDDLQSGDAVSMLRELKAEAIVHVFPHRAVAQWAKSAGIRTRVGTSHRWWHWFTCNVRVSFSRKRSVVHEALLNFKLLEPFGVNAPRTIGELVPLMGLQPPEPSRKVKALLHDGKDRLVIHPSVGSGVGWGLRNYEDLIRALDPARWQVIVTGTASEAEVFRKELPMQRVTDAGGKLDLEELMMLIGSCDAMVAASTGPLHLAAAMGLRTIGLFAMRRPIFPARWAPVGKDAHALVLDPACASCAAGDPCDCITRIPVQRVLDLLSA
ncbi:MAG TPA: glycosyltransferase family 9 protein [Flavobacteriales bacterium]|nr:glycosyltransferase family 9 protein [Flavobacteriales bacterium]